MTVFNWGCDFIYLVLKMISIIKLNHLFNLIALPKISSFPIYEWYKNVYKINEISDLI